MKEIQFWMFFALPVLLLVFVLREYVFAGKQWREVGKRRFLVSESMGLVFLPKTK